MPTQMAFPRETVYQIHMLNWQHGLHIIPYNVYGFHITLCNKLWFPKSAGFCFPCHLYLMNTVCNIHCSGDGTFWAKKGTLKMPAQCVTFYNSLIMSPSYHSNLFFYHPQIETSSSFTVNSAAVALNNRFCNEPH